MLHGPLQEGECGAASEQLEEWVPSCYPFCGMEVVVHKGYGLERHYATTPDGYILGLFRLLPRGEKSAARLARSPDNDDASVVGTTHEWQN